MPRGNEENGVVAAIPKPIRGINVRPRQRVNQSTLGGQTVGNALLPSALPATRQSENIIPVPFQPPAIPLPASQKATFAQPSQRNVTSSVLPRTRSAANISHKKSASLSSTQNTRSSKRLKTSHTAPIPPPTSTALATQNPPVDVKQPPTTPNPAPTKQKRILPVRHGHIDILDGEISLLSTPQRLDSTFPPVSSKLTHRPSAL